MLTRENLTGCLRRRNARSSRTTAGTLTTTVTVRTDQSYSSTTSTLPRVRSVSARCHETTLIGSYDWLRTRVRVSCVVAVMDVSFPWICWLAVPPGRVELPLWPSEGRVASARGGVVNDGGSARSCTGVM